MQNSISRETVRNLSTMLMQARRDIGDISDTSLACGQQAFYYIHESDESKGFKVFGVQYYLDKQLRTGQVVLDRNKR